MIIVDTSYWLAIANKRDQFHELVMEKTRHIDEDLITTWPVLTETCHLLLSRLGVHAQVKFIQQISSFTSLFEMNNAHLSKCADLMHQYRELPMDLTDASLVVLAESLGEGKIISTDQRDFDVYRWKNHKPFINLLFTQ
jgi:predicted nucleic acid-binding protein